MVKAFLRLLRNPQFEPTFTKELKRLQRPDLLDLYKNRTRGLQNGVLGQLLA